MTAYVALLRAVNVGGTANMIDAARKAGVRRFIQISSLAAREPELSDYGRSKARAERLVAASGLEWTILRPPARMGETAPVVSEKSYVESEPSVTPAVSIA